jgi:N-acetylneuraminic acid mutarotase
MKALRKFIPLILCGAAGCLVLGMPLLAFLRAEAPANVSDKILTFEERVAYQRAIEDVYWRHRIWPKENSDSKPLLDAVMSQAQLEKKVSDYLRKSRALADYCHRPITARQLQAEMDRMALNTKQPEVLQELFDALGNDPFVIAECLARLVLTNRLIADLSAQDKGARFGSAQTEQLPIKSLTPMLERLAYTLPRIREKDSSCTDDNWTAIATINAPNGRRLHTAMWTGSEMIVWGGTNNGTFLNTGGRYTPATDSWIATSTNNAPEGRDYHTAVWTGSEMIVWGGLAPVKQYFNTGGKYDPGTDTWTSTTTNDAPDARWAHSAVWTGTEMIVWGGRFGNNTYFNTGGRYNPITDNWTATGTINAPTARSQHTAVWTGNEMIVWGGIDPEFNTGGRYNPITDGWTATSNTNAPTARFGHTAVCTGNEMIVWGGTPDDISTLDTGGIYDLSSDSWTATSLTNVPTARLAHRTVWTGTEMIVWGGKSYDGNYHELNTGGRYNVDTNSWIATSVANPPFARSTHTAVWTGSEMIVWGGWDTVEYFNGGGKYCAAAPAPTATPTPSATTAPTATPTVSPTPTAAPRATARPRPTPHPRPSPLR